MSKESFPISLHEASLDTGLGIKHEHIVAYTYPPGNRKRYTDEGWRVFQILNGIIPSSVGEENE